MNILQITQEFPPNITGGVGYHSYELARQFSELSHKVTVLTTDTGESKDDATNFDFSGLDILRLSPPTTIAPRPIFNRMVRRYLKKTDCSVFDIIHSHEFIDLDGINVAPPTVLKIHYNLCQGREFSSIRFQNPIIRHAAKLAENSLIAPYERKLEQKSLATTDGRVYISNLTNTIYKKRYNHMETGETHQIVPNGINFRRFTVESSTVKDEYFLAVTGSQRRKGYDILLDVFDRNPELKLKIAGSLKGESPPTQDNIEILGHVAQSELASLYRGAIALVHPARYEPFGNVILESLASGTPVVVSNASYCGATEFLDDDVHIAVDPESPESVANALYKLEDEVGVTPQECRDSVEDFTWKNVAEKTLTFADQLMR